MSIVFCLEEFAKKEIREKFLCIVLSKLNKYPLTDFNSLSLKDKRIGNEILNEYIHNLPKDDWMDKLTTDFNRVCTEEIFNNKKIDYTSSLFKQQPYENFEPIIETDELSILK
jgi:hypothetical protein